MEPFFDLLIANFSTNLAYLQSNDLRKKVADAKYMKHLPYSHEV